MQNETITGSPFSIGPRSCDVDHSYFQKDSTGKNVYNNIMPNLTIPQETLEDNLVIKNVNTGKDTMLNILIETYKPSRITIQEIR